MLPARHEVSVPPPPARTAATKSARAAHGRRGRGGAHAWHFPASLHLPAHPLVAPDNAALELELELEAELAGLGEEQPPQNGYTQKMEVAYWYNMHQDMGECVPGCVCRAERAGPC